MVSKRGNNKLTVLADENMPLVAHFFSGFADIRFANGRSIAAGDVKDVDILLVRSVTQVNAKLLTGSKVQFVGSATIGTDHIDTDYLQQQGIGFASAPGCNANAVVQFVISALSEQLGDSLFSAKVAIVGCGNVGSSLYRKLRQLDIDCIAYDPYLEGRANLRFASFEQVLQADVICVHTPLEKYSKYPSYHLFDATAIEQLKPGCVLLNAGRGGVIDNHALLARLQRARDLKTVLDVWEFEPEIMPALLPLVDIATPHIAGYSQEGKTKGSEMVYRACMAHFKQPSELTSPQSNKQCLDASEFGAELLGLLRQTYAIKQDDTALRASQDPTLSVETRAKAFDLLRKNYPQRREFENYQVRGIQDTQLQQRLQLLGFEII